MFKFLILAGLAYFAYRIFFHRPQIDQRHTKDVEDSDFVDYEELD
jgi:hypothetical protein